MGACDTMKKLARQYYLLMWKNFLLLRRSPFRIAIEIVWPLVLFLILAAVRSRQSLVEHKPECHFHNKPMPSAGLLPFFQGVVCLSNNTCNEREVVDELSGTLTSFQTTRVEALVTDTANFLANDSQRNVLQETVEEAQKIASALEKVQGNYGSVGQLLAIDEPAFYEELERNNVSLTNRTVDLFFFETMVNSTALIDELYRIQEANPTFVPLLETLAVDWLQLDTLLMNDSEIWSRAFADDFGASLGEVSNASINQDTLTQRLDTFNFTGLNIGNILAQIRGASSAEEIPGVISNVGDAEAVRQQLEDALNLTTLQQQVIADNCQQAEYEESAACILLELVGANGSDTTTLLNRLCSQPRYGELVTCLLYDFTNVQDIADASAAANALCSHHIVSNSSVCDIVKIEKELTAILANVNPYEVLCNDNTCILIYSSEEVREEVQPKLCNLTRQELTTFLTLMFDHINQTALSQTYFPDGLNLAVLFQLAANIEQLMAMPSVQAIMADLDSIASSQSLSVSLCGEAVDIPILAPVAALTQFMETANSTDNVTAPSASLEEIEEEIDDDIIAQNEYLNHNSSDWSHHRHCRGLFRDLLGSGGSLGDLIYRQLEPILFGKIPYSPDTATINETIRRANETFEAIATIKQASDDIRKNYKDWEVTLNEVGERLFDIDRLLNLSTLGSDNPVPAVSGVDLVSPQEFWETMVNAASEAAVLPNMNIPDNLTEVVEMLKEFSLALEENGAIYNMVDDLGNITSMVYRYLDCVELDKFEPYQSEHDLVDRSVDLIESGRYWAAIVFDDDLVERSELPSHITYKIRMNTNKVDDTDQIEDKYWQPRPRARPPWDTKYITFGFAYLQDMIEHSLIELLTNDETKVGIYLQQFPFPCYNVDFFMRSISRTLPLFMVLSWIFSVALLVKSIVYEKQERLKEQMKIMGLTNGIHWVAWYTVSIVLIAPSIFFLCVIFKHAKILQHSDPSIMGLLLFAFSFATTGQAFLFSVFFTKANLAACCGAIFYFTLYLPYAVVNQYEQTMTDWMKGIACLLSPVAFGLGTTYVSRFEEQGVGIQWDNISKSPLPDDTYSLSRCIGMLFLDGILYCLIAWYKEYVFPGKYGMPKPFYFPFTKSFWCGSSTTAHNTPDQPESGSVENVQCEAEPTHLKLGVKLQNLRKVYSAGKKLAVDNLSLNFYEDQITSFLGHNGAGKTTTMSILCGLFPPTSGTAYVYDKDIRQDLDEVRRSMGFCPQFNVLYDMLTVSEHILFYGQLKGLSYKQAEEEMMNMLLATGMMPKKNARAKSLSGGMKRKLSVMCAFVGGSKCVILDEPTAGVDPYSRRQIWELLLKFKQGRTILLSTHHMDEADFLGDRIAIISQGKLCCAGSSLYLKGLHGNGYYLTLVRAENEQAAQSLEKEIEGFVTSRVPGSVLMDSAGQEMVFQLPSEETKTGAFTKLFTDLDSSMEKLSISDYGICDTTLEEIFIKIADETGVDTEDLLTDGGNLAKPPSFRWKSGARKALSKLRSRISQLRFKKSRKNYQLHQGEDGASVGHPSLSDISEVDADLENAQNNLRPDIDNSGNSTDGGLSEDEDTIPVSDGGQLSFRFSNGQVDTNIQDESAVDYEDKAHKLSGWRLIYQQMLALIVKRFHHIRRDKIAFLCEIILPAFFILLSMAFSLAVPPIKPQPPLELQPWMYEPDSKGAHLNVFYRNEYVNSSFTKSLEELVAESQYGTRCMNPDVYQIDGLPCKTDVESYWTAQNSNISPECNCEDTGYQQCEGIPAMPANITLSNNDHLLNLTGHNVSEWLVKTMEPYIMRRFGGFSFDVGGSEATINESDIESIIEGLMPNRSIIAADIAESIEDLLDSVNIHENIKVWFNNKGWASSVSYMNAANNMIMRQKLKLAGNKNYRDFGLTAINHPMNRTDYQLQKELANRGYITLLISLCVIFAMSLIPATFVLYLIMDKVSTSKNLQYVSGMNRTIYWLTNFFWDMMNYIICASLCFLIFLAFNEKAFVSATNGPCLALLLLLYGWAMIPFMYPFSYVFKESSMAYVLLGCLNIFLGIISTVSTYILELFPEEPELTEISVKLKKAFLILPHYCLGRGLMDMSVQHLRKDLLENLGSTYDYNPFEMEIVGKNFVALFVQGSVFFFLVIMIEHNFFIRWKATAKPKDLPEMDNDVLAEEEAVTSGSRPNDVLATKSLTKLFKKSRAVNGLNFGVPAGQCFGLLGVNGAGKTTTFRMLTGIMNASGGDAFMMGHSITKEPIKVQQYLGYCPQFDAIDPLLTVMEHLEYYAKLRGVPRTHASAVAQKKVRKMGLTRYKNKRAGDLSGGNKRKLQAAIALIGNPPIIFMDEPTTGMDPKARRFLWESIMKITKEGHAVVLTSHSMEECEVLCNRLAIMVNGTFRCLGTPQHLKSKYGEGYHVTIRLTRDTTSEIACVISAMETEFQTSATLLESSLLMAQYHISVAVPVADIFSSLENIRTGCQVEDYSVTQTSLDHVFIRFAKQQTDGLATVDSTSSDDQLMTPPSRSNSRVNLII